MNAPVVPKQVVAVPPATIGELVEPPTIILPFEASMKLNARVVQDVVVSEMYCSCALALTGDTKGDSRLPSVEAKMANRSRSLRYKWNKCFDLVLHFSIRLREAWNFDS